MGSMLAALAYATLTHEWELCRVSLAFPEGSGTDDLYKKLVFMQIGGVLQDRLFKADGLIEFLQVLFNDAG